MAGVGPLDRPDARAGLSPSDTRMTDLAVRNPARARLELRALAVAARLAPRAAIKAFAKECGPVDRPFLDSLGSLDFFVEACRGGARGVVLDYRLWAEPWGFELGEVIAPVHLFQGTADTIVPVHHAEDLAARVPNAALHRLDGEGHLSITGRIGEILAMASGQP
jgi:pimeloyl-ACP methyl ester carboxylesterase